MTANPLMGPPPPEVPLPTASLVRVVAHVRFPMVAAVENRAFIDEFQESVRGEYGVLREQRSQRYDIKLTGSTPAQVSESTVWRFTDVDQRWTVTLGSEFLAIETTRYTSRDDFFGRFERLLHAVQTHIQPATMDRLGVRYIDRLVGEPLRDLRRYIRPKLMGVLASALYEHALVAVSETHFALPDEVATLRACQGPP